MKATGIVRRIDDLGRVVIPKEIRRTLRIREGDPLEIYTAKGGEVIFKKYSPISELSGFAAEYAATLGSVTGFACAVVDRDNVIAFAGVGKREAIDKPLSPRCEEVMVSRHPFTAGGELPPFPLLRDQDTLKVAACWPIIAGGDIMGMLCLLDTAEKRVSHTEERLLQAGALFLGKQMEDV
ncbi:MAG: AbrB/MazE/SpoVT family DNA-binding domain-containing protein [Clostridia bacterium]|nr:AbrB/MazE/SpoVT family DNA-binding domain-containing protein [Clostridia bacterium]